MANAAGMAARMFAQALIDQQDVEFAAFWDASELKAQIAAVDQAALPVIRSAARVGWMARALPGFDERRPEPEVTQS